MVTPGFTTAPGENALRERISRWLEQPSDTGVLDELVMSAQSPNTAEHRENSGRQ